MISSGFKKFAQSNGMKISAGVGYGSLMGYAATLSDGSGCKIMILSTRFPDAAAQVSVQNQLDKATLLKQYRVRTLEISEKTILIVFNDTIGTMDKIKAFCQWFFPLLDAANASKANTCAECGADAPDGCWKLINGVACHLHPGCASHVEQTIRQEEDAIKEADTGSYSSGFLGALLGSALGSLVWALISTLGFVSSLVGLLIGWLADRGYRLCHGKMGKGMVGILVCTVVLGVLLGTLLTPVFLCLGWVITGEAVGGVLTVTLDMVPALVQMIFADPDVQSSLIGDFLLGLLFAALGVWGTIRSAAKEVSETSIIDLP